MTFIPIAGLDARRCQSIGHLPISATSSLNEQTHEYVCSEPAIIPIRRCIDHKEPAGSLGDCYFVAGRDRGNCGRLAER
jgi:hypothetical protein